MGTYLIKYEHHHTPCKYTNILNIYFIYACWERSYNTNNTQTGTYKNKINQREFDKFKVFWYSVILNTIKYNIPVNLNTPHQ